MLDYSLYLVTDRSLSRGRSTFEVVRQAVAGGVTCVQLREKHCSTREFIDQARALQPLLKDRRIPLIINDRLDVALAVGAEGVHLGQQDMAIADARKIAGRALVIGISVESVGDAIRAEQQGADYLGVSPVFATPTKTDTAPPLGLEGIRQIRRAVVIPIVGIGGVNLRSAASVLGAGADGIAVVSAIVSADDPKQAAVELRKIIADSAAA
jgi:thiamine-phosphate pyrophosphorylase